MSDFRENLLNRAFRIVRGVDYNRARRELIEQSEIVPVIYEVVLPEQGSWESFRDATFPLLVRYAKSQGIDPENPPSSSRRSSSRITAILSRASS
jgi:hypothetical protein